MLIFGYGRSGRAVEQVLLDMHIAYKIYDKSIRIGGGDYILNLNKNTLKMFDLVVISPGVSIYNKYVRLCMRYGIKVIGELEFGYLVTNTKIIGVTGTNGKTSTVGLITSILQASGYKAESYGNIGNPLSNAYGKKLDYAVVEVSSFQLESIDTFRCDIAAIINIDEDHLDRHKTLKNYINCKLNIARNSTESDTLILNFDDKTCSSVNIDTSAKVLYTCANHVVEGVYIKDGAVYYNNGVGITRLYDIDNKFKVEYIDNILIATCVARVLGIDSQVITKCIKKWSILPHRLQFVTKVHGVKYIDDSKSTNLHSVFKAIDSVNGNIILLLGGQNKKLKFDELISKLPKNVKGVIAFGQCGKSICKICKKYNVVSEYAAGVDGAVCAACGVAVDGDTVLFSPGCASFDAFSSYAERGEYYQKCVLGLVNNEKQKD